MDNVNTELQMKIEKRKFDRFTLDDVSEYLTKKAKENGKVYSLKKNKWVMIGKNVIYLKSVSFDMDDAWVNIIIRKYHSIFDWISLFFAGFFEKTEQVVWWHKIPNTDLMLDVWFVGDGSEGVPLVFEVEDKKEN